MSEPRAELNERRDLALRDLAELDDQLAAGEIDPATADRLRIRYESDAAAAVRALRRLDEGATAPISGTAEPRRWVLAGVASLALVAAVAATVVLPRFVGARPPGGFVTGNEAVSDGRDLSQVTNEEMEQVVAANPDVVDMRLRLAHRYLDDGQNREAFRHYMAVLDREPHPEAMSHLGWIVFQDGDVDLGLQLLEASLERAPDDAETLWFLANVQLYGRSDAGAALPLLERLLERGDLGAQRTQVEDAIRDARRLEDRP